MCFAGYFDLHAWQQHTGSERTRTTPERDLLRPSLCEDAICQTDAFTLRARERQVMISLFTFLRLPIVKTNCKPHPSETLRSVWTQTGSLWKREREITFRTAFHCAIQMFQANLHARQWFIKTAASPQTLLPVGRRQLIGTDSGLGSGRTGGWAVVESLVFFFLKLNLAFELCLSSV